MPEDSDRTSHISAEHCEQYIAERSQIAFDGFVRRPDSKNAGREKRSAVAVVWDTLQIITECKGGVAGRTLANSTDLERTAGFACDTTRSESHAFTKGT